MKRAKRIASYDGLKGLSIFFVVLYHLLPKSIPGGFLMVNTFFVVAGYFYARKLESFSDQNHQLDWNQIKNYLITTFKRLFIPLLAFMIVMISGLYVFYPVELHFIRSDVLSSLFFFNNFYQILAGKSYFVKMADASPFTHLWYSALYLQFFIVAIPLVWFTKKTKMTLPQKAIFWLLIMYASHVLVAFLYQPGADPSRVYYGLETRFASFAAGIAVVYVTPTVLNFLYNWSYKLLFYNISGVLSLLGMIWLCLNVQDQADISYIALMPAFNVLSLILVFAIVTGSPIIRKSLAFKPLVYLGKRSYSFYLWYYPVTVLVSKNSRFFNQNEWLMALVAWLLLLVVGEAFYRLIEKDQTHLLFGPSMTYKEDFETLVSHFDPKFAFDKTMAKFVVSIIVVCLFLLGSINLRDHKRVALFELEYQEYLTSNKMGKVEYPAAKPLIRMSEDLGNLDKKFETGFVNQPETEDARKMVDQMLDVNGESMASLSQAIAKYKEEVDILRAKSPDLAAMMSPQEIAFASKTPVFQFGDSQARRTGDFLVTAFTQGDYYGKVSLQIWDAIPIYQEMVSSGQVTDNVVVIIGTNAGLDQESMDDFMKASGDRQVFFVNTNSAVAHRDSVNQIISDTTKKYSNAHVVDWYGYSLGHPEWYAEDDIHFSIEGCNEYVALVARTMMEVLE